jgi:hypothetical protein
MILNAALIVCLTDGCTPKQRAGRTSPLTRKPLCQERIMHKKPLLYLSFCVIALCGCSDQPENSDVEYTATNGPLSITIKQVSLSKIYEPNTGDGVVVDVWSLLERTDGIAISNKNNVTLGGLTLMRVNGQEIPIEPGVGNTLYSPNNIPWDYGWVSGQKTVLKNNQRLLRHRLYKAKGLQNVSQVNMEITVGLSGEGQELRPFLFKRVPIR